MICTPVPFEPWHSWRQPTPGDGVFALKYHPSQFGLIEKEERRKKMAAALPGDINSEKMHCLGRGSWYKQRKLSNRHAEILVMEASLTPLCHYYS
jgi:hypothetical protein